MVDCIGVGVVVATIMWHISNKYLMKETCMEEDVEWAYAFDVHLNAFFPLFIILHVFQLFFYHGKMFLSYRYVKFWSPLGLLGAKFQKPLYIAPIGGKLKIPETDVGLFWLKIFSTEFHICYSIGF